MTESAFTGGSLVDWQMGLQKEKADPELIRLLEEPSDPYAVTRELGLPTPPYISFGDVGLFLDNPESHLTALHRQGIDAYYVGLRPLVDGLPKYRELGLNAAQVPEYIANTVQPSDRGRYLLRIAEYAPALYGVTMVVNPDGIIHADIVHGEMAKLATGHVTPDYVALSDEFSGVLRYTQHNSEVGPAEESLRRAVWRAISYIPKVDTESDIRSRRVPGYYEFSVINRRSGLVPVFFDAKLITKSNGIFRLPGVDQTYFRS